MKIKLKNWRDENGSDLDKAKALILNKDTNLSEVSRILDMPVQTLRNYRAKPETLNKASWTRINQLAQVNDVLIISENISADDVLAINNQIHQMMDYLKEDYEGQELSLEMIKQMEIVLTSDPEITYKIFKALSEK